MCEHYCQIGAIIFNCRFIDNHSGLHASEVIIPNIVIVWSATTKNLKTFYE